MKLIITIKQGRKKVRTIETEVTSTEFSLEVMRKVWETEQMLNSLSTDLRWHFNLEENI